MPHPLDDPVRQSANQDYCMGADGASVSSVNDIPTSAFAAPRLRESEPLPRPGHRQSGQY